MHSDGKKTFHPTTGNQSLHETSKENGVIGVKYSPSKILIVKNTTVPHQNIH
jgi:hypothetical protein